MEILNYCAPSTGERNLCLRKHLIQRKRHGRPDVVGDAPLLPGTQPAKSHRRLTDEPASRRAIGQKACPHWHTRGVIDRIGTGARLKPCLSATTEPKPKGSVVVRHRAEADLL
jgi:hypothetical protein